MPINSVTLPLKSTYTSHGIYSSFYFNFISPQSQINPVFWLIKHYL